MYNDEQEVVSKEKANLKKLKRRISGLYKGKKWKTVKKTSRLTKKVVFVYVN